MNYRLNVTGKNLGEIYTINFPENLIKFIQYDFTPFMEKCIELCRTAMKQGVINFDEVSVIRSSIVPCHRYFEKNIRGIFEKIVIDCWIEYICRQNEIGSSTLWNSFSGCRTDFESVLFVRLCEFRYNNAINQWVNLLRIQEYARKKVEFIFGKRLDDHSTAIAKAGYFDLLFNVAANEMGYSDLSTNRIYSGLRTPNSPFVMSGVSREIMRNVLAGINLDNDDYGEENPMTGTSRRPDFTADKHAMEAFTAIKNTIPDEPDTIINTIMKSIPRQLEQVYVPESFKSVIDLEIDALLENGGVIQKCGRCLGYFLKDDDYNYDYCSRVENFRSCLQIMDEKIAAEESVASVVSTVDASVLQARCDQLYKEMAERVNVDINQRDFSDWYKYMALIRENVISGQAKMDDFENFAEYSRSIRFASPAKLRSNASNSRPTLSSSLREPSRETPKYKQTDESGREVKSFEFERIDTSHSKKENKTIAQLHGIDIADDIISDEPFAPTPFTSQSTVTQVPYTPVTTTRVIRGVVPMGVKELSKPEQVVVEEPPEITEESTQLEQINAVEPKTPMTNKDEFVKVYSKTPVPNTNRPKSPPIERNVKSQETGDLLQNPFIKELIKVDEQPTPHENKQLTIMEDAEDIDTKLELQSKDANIVNLIKDKEVSVEAPTAPQLDFNSILSGLQRSDGFEPGSSSSNMEDDVAVSHKTKRVMDAIFGKNKITNPFVKQDENND